MTPLSEILNDHYMVWCRDEKEMPFEIKYNTIKTIKFNDSLKKESILSQKGEHVVFETGKLGRIKSDYWDFQKEYRYKFVVLPVNPRSAMSEANMQADIDRIVHLEDLPFKDYYLKLTEKALSSMEILLGPNTNEADKEIVHLLIDKYNLQ